MPVYWWAFGLLAASVMWYLTFRDTNRERAVWLALPLALVYTVGLLVALLL